MSVLIETDQPKPGILIVDDEPDILFILSKTFDSDKFAVDTAANGTEAIEKISINTYSLILLDLNMQPINGVEVLAALRKINQETAVIILTAHSTLDSAIEALRLGAFDYLIKPVEPAEIRLRASAALKQYERNHLFAQNLARSPEMPAPSSVLQHGELTLDLRERTAVLSGKPLDLTTTEFNLLLSLVQASPRPVLPARLVSQTLGYTCSSPEAADIIKFHIHHLRQKLEPDPLNPRYIKTVRFQGYLWCG